MKKFLTLLSLVILTLSSAHAQTTLPNLPPSIKWQQLNTPHFKIIYPQGFEVQGLRMANTLEHLYEPVSKSLNAHPKKIPIILQNQHAVANGFVTLGPRRSEFYTMAPQNYNFAGTNDWLDMLAIHEFRHVVQYDRSRTGFTKFVGYVLGEFSRNATASASVPSWFWEGDAVGVETALTHSGRGRFPNFSMAFRANLLEKGSFNYSKQYLRSFKDFIPNHYVLGYHFSTYIKNKYGAKAMENIVESTWNVPFIPFEYSFAMNKATGSKMPVLYNQMMEELKEKWQDQIESESLNDYQTLTVRKTPRFTNYTYPQPINGGGVLALKSGLDDIPQFVSVNPDTKEEKKEFILGPMNNPGFISVAGNTVVWTEYRYDPRWLTRSYSVVSSYNLATKSFRQLTSKSRYSAAAISPDRTKIVVVETTDDYANRLVILNANSGTVIKKIENEEDGFYSMPRWDDTGHSIVVLNQFDQKKGVLLINYESGDKKVILPYSYEHIGFPIIHQNYLIYNSGLTGIDNIYALNLTSAKKFRITSAKYGASNPAISLDGKTILYNNYVVEGNDIASIPFAPGTWQPIEQVKNTDIKLYAPLVEKENNSNVLLNVPDSAYQAKRYRKKPFNVHSWGPLFTGSLTEIELGVYSKNVLSTTDVFAGVEFDNVGNVKGVGRVSYQGWYPIVDVVATYGNRVANTTYRDTLDVIRPDRVTWTETTVKAGLRLPFLLTRSKFQSKIEVYNYIGVTSVTNFISQTFGDNRYRFNQVGNGSLIQNEFVITWYNLLNQNKRDINSRFGQTLTFENFSTPYGGDLQGGLTILKSQLFFPGLFKHHSLNFFAGWQNQKITLTQGEYWFNNRMPYPRGHTPEIFNNFYTIRSNYDLPLIHPDLRIGPFVYIQRIKAKLFYDYGYGRVDIPDESIEYSRSFQSAGIDLTFDFNVMRALPLLELGVRAVYLPDTQEARFEFLIGSIGF
ncbi:MAG: hypothetical protein L3J06_01180 [Cyclobacteriaceae bacterium]|nr:hypothetical protein [Cyclobacteriaceae bacterium]